MTRGPRQDESPEALFSKAVELDLASSREEAVLAYQAFLEVEPNDAGAWSNYGGLLMMMGRLGAAEDACRRALAIDPDYASAMVNLAGTWLRMGKADEAEFLSRRAIVKDPQDAEAPLVLADCLMKRKNLQGAREVLERLLQCRPSSQGAQARLNNLYIWQNDWAQLRRLMVRQLDVFSGREAEYEHSLLHLLFGEMQAGWAGYEARLDVPGRIRPERRFLQPRWRGEPFQERTLLVHYEQGLGDTLMFLRYLPMVKALGGTVLLLVQPALVDLVAAGSCADQVVLEGAGLPPFDMQISLMSLPAVFHTDLDTIPAEIPYLAIPAVVPNRLRIDEALAAVEHGLRVGLAWAGNPDHKKDADRSMPATSLRPLGGLQDVGWFSFQLEKAELPPLPGLVSLAPWLGCFSDTAYALGQVDLMITVDTSLAHLAGALGIPVFLMVPFQPDFRWMLHREDSPWYPSMRIYRQASPGDWDSVIQRILSDLAGATG
mgnify:CR=1 FL=1